MITDLQDKICKVANIMFITTLHYHKIMITILAESADVRASVIKEYTTIKL